VSGVSGYLVSEHQELIVRTSHMCHSGDGQHHISRSLSSTFGEQGRALANSQVFSFDMADKPLRNRKDSTLSTESLVCAYLVPTKCRAVGSASGWGCLRH
jgi:hypothetical protein